ncbi:unnamed protein product [Amoebophrya sp. A25]|nr:unnamed protein product [Amoebophrya sp. A25]|eukprot:GSA25T00018658001.1
MSAAAKIAAAASRTKKNDTDELNERRMVILDRAKLKPNMPAYQYLKKIAGRCGKECISVSLKKEIEVWDEMCLACLNRAKKTPDDAVKVVKLPSNLTADTTHQYGANAFKLHRLPMPSPGQVVGILGSNGTGKSTACKVLAGTLKPNLGNFRDKQPTWQEIVKYYRGSDLQNYFSALVEDRLTVSMKPQLDSDYARQLRGQKVSDFIDQQVQERCLPCYGGAKTLPKWFNTRKTFILDQMELGEHLLNRDCGDLSGGEMQRLAIAMACLPEANVYIFDEPSSFLDVKQRLTAVRLIRQLAHDSSSLNRCGRMSSKKTSEPGTPSTAPDHETDHETDDDTNKPSEASSGLEDVEDDDNASCEVKTPTAKNIYKNVAGDENTGSEDESAEADDDIAACSDGEDDWANSSDDEAAEKKRCPGGILKKAAPAGGTPAKESPQAEERLLPEDEKTVEENHVDDAGHRLGGARYVVAIEHDLAVLDYMSDYVHCMYGAPGAYGVVTRRSSIRNGINNFLAGYFPAENMKFRKEELSFKVSHAQTLKEIGSAKQGAGVAGSGDASAANKKVGQISYPRMTKTLTRTFENTTKPSETSKVTVHEATVSSFTLHVSAGGFTESEVIGMVGENGTGKTTYLSLLAGLYDKKPQKTNRGEGAAFTTVSRVDEELESEAISLVEKGCSVALKRQDYAPRFRRYPGVVKELLERNITRAYCDTMFKLFVLRPLQIDELLELPVATLSGGELQRLAIVVCLGTPATVYLFDEPSAGLDCEQRVKVAKVIRRWTRDYLHRTCFVIEHDAVMITAMADRIICFSGQPGVEATASEPMPMAVGFNRFLRELNVTLRRDPCNHRPRINKPESVKDREQKLSGNYYCFDVDEMGAEDVKATRNLPFSEASCSRLSREKGCC